MHDLNQEVTVSGGVGGIFNGPTTFAGPVPEPTQTFTVRKATMLPVSERVLSALGSLVTLLGLGGLWQTGTRLWASRSQLLGGRPQDAPSTELLYWLLASLVLCLIASVIWAGRRLARNRLMYFTPTALLPVLAGVNGPSGGRLALVRLGGTCIKCGGRLRFYNKAMAWHTGEDGKRVVDEREPVAECRRNPKHCYAIDIADKLDMD